MKNTNKSRDMKNARRCRVIYGDEIKLRRIGLMYPEGEPNFLSDKRNEEFDGYTNRGYKKNLRYVNVGPITHMVMRLTIAQWNELKDGLGDSIIKKKGTRNNRDWELI